MREEVVIMAGGEAGQGVQSVGAILARSLSQGGLHVFADQDYESRVRGGHNFFRIRGSKKAVRAINPSLDILVALNRETVELHRRELAQGGKIIFDAETSRIDLTGPQYLDVPLVKIAADTTGNQIMANTVAVGAVLGMGNFKFEVLAAALKKEFAKHGQKIVDDNIKAARAGYDFTRSHGETIPFPSYRDPLSRAERILLNGNDAFALGALVGGCRFTAGYPMTPASSVLEYFADTGRKYGAVAVHAEDEIAAMNMAVGAGYTGARSLVATSGGGFALMVEALALAGITETPVVVFLGQRPGPATGLPTRTEQGELWFALHAGHGEFPRAVLTPSSHEEAFQAGINAFNLAEKYQTPVLVLSDHHLATSYATIDRPDFKEVVIDRGELIPDKDVDGYADYKRHLVTRSGISPRALPGQGKALVVTDSDEHDEAGHMIEDAATRNRQVEKRLRKVRGLRKDMLRPSLRTAEGAEITLIGWGSTGGAIHEAVEILKEHDLPVNMLHLNQVWPFPATQVINALEKTPHCIVVEGNATGQLEQLLRRETGKTASASIRKYDGRPLTPEIIARSVRKEVNSW